MKLIRQNSFETNSSSCHTIVLRNDSVKHSVEDFFGYDPISLSKESLSDKESSLPYEGGLLDLPYGQYEEVSKILSSQDSFSDYCMLQLLDSGVIHPELSYDERGWRIACYLNLIVGERRYRYQSQEEREILEESGYDVPYPWLDSQSTGIVSSLEDAIDVMKNAKGIFLDSDKEKRFKLRRGFVRENEIERKDYL